jgi:tRNA dimethylallyltransferase
VLFGPTGVGKSETLSRLLDERFEVISADSMQTYRHMDIGTDKPPAGVQRRFPHHLLSIVDPSEQFNAGQFVTRAEALVPEIRARGKVAVVSGGTAFYIRSFLFGLPESPPGSPAVREELQGFEREHGHRPLYEELVRADPEAAARIPANDRYRILRALEVLRTTGRSVFSFHWPRTLRTDYRFLILGLERPREELYRRIDLRVRRMFEAGLVDEVRGLIGRGYGPRDPGMRAIGYKEFFEMQRGCLSLAAVEELIRRNTRRYAKRQMTLFRTVPSVEWMNADDGEGLSSRVEAFLRRALDQGRENPA